MSLSMPEKQILIKEAWAEEVTHAIELTDDELIVRIQEYEKLQIVTQTKYEALKHEAKRREGNLRSKFAEAQRELDRKYNPTPHDKIAFDEKAKQEKVKLSKDEKAIKVMMGLGMSESEAAKMLADAKAGKVAG